MVLFRRNLSAAPFNIPGLMPLTEESCKVLIEHFIVSARDQARIGDLELADKMRRRGLHVSGYVVRQSHAQETSPASPRQAGRRGDRNRCTRAGRRPWHRGRLRQPPVEASGQAMHSPATNIQKRSYKLLTVIKETLRGRGKLRPIAIRRVLSPLLSLCCRQSGSGLRPGRFCGARASLVPLDPVQMTF
jgi:hypothetical protein